MMNKMIAMKITLNKPFLIVVDQIISSIIRRVRNRILGHGFSFDAELRADGRAPEARAAALEEALVDVRPGALGAGALVHLGRSEKHISYRCV